ncbi:MAG: choice-of-anchor J domain-containing protein, partial [Bacteroidales bacterium]|nr:choice-of-anchor J domain-containing protein [Bacteroidales bacterium]
MKKIFTSLIAILLLNFAVLAQQNAQMSAARSFNAPTMTAAASKPVKQNRPIAAKDANDGVIFYEDFNNGLANWQNINADGDSWSWELRDLDGAGNYCAMSRSYYYDSVSHALTPDNWLISPSFTIPADGAMLTWYDITFNTSYP